MEERGTYKELKENQCWNFRTIYGGKEPSRNRVVAPTRQYLVLGTWWVKLYNDEFRFPSPSVATNAIKSKFIILFGCL